MSVYGAVLVKLGLVDCELLVSWLLPTVSCNNFKQYRRSLSPGGRLRTSTPDLSKDT
jgi:hypothetical protein